MFNVLKEPLMLWLLVIVSATLFAGQIELDVTDKLNRSTNIEQAMNEHKI